MTAPIYALLQGITLDIRSELPAEYLAPIIFGFVAGIAISLFTNHIGVAVTGISVILLVILVYMNSINLPREDGDIRLFGILVFIIGLMIGYIIRYRKRYRRLTSTDKSNIAHWRKMKP